MKKIFIINILLIMMISVFAGQALAADRPHLDVSLLSYSPVPAQPGSYVTVTLKVLNDGDTATNNAVIEFIDNYPFSMDDSKIITIGKLGVEETYLAEYRVRIDSAAIEGTNYLKVRYNTDKTTDNWIEKNIPLTINSAQKTLTINAVDVEPEMVPPGEQATIKLKVKNLASASLREVGVKLNLEGIVIGSSYVDIPLAPIGSSIEKRISLLRSGETADFDFILQAYPEAEAGIYKVPVTLAYTDDSGQEYSRTDLISVIINGDADIMIQVDESTLYSDNGQGEVTFSITNKGFSEIKFLTVTLAESDAYTIKSMSNEVYIGNVDSDDYETTSFIVQMKEQGNEEVTLPVTLTFKDALNKEYTIEKEISLPLISTADAGQKKSNTGTIIFVIIIIVVIGFFVMRARKKKHKK